MADRPTVLDLDTLSSRQVVKVDGKPYDLLGAGELSVLVYHRIGKWSAESQSLLKHAEAGEPSEADVATLASLLDRMCRAVLRAPDDVHERLSDSQRLQVVMAFTDLQRKATAPAGSVEEPPSTGESKSPA